MQDRPPPSRMLNPYIKILPGSEDPYEVGAVLMMIAGIAPKSWALADGKYLECNGHQSIYALVGDQFCPPFITKKTVWWKWILCIAPARVIIPNPDYRKGFFKLPNLIGEVKS